MPTRSDRKSIVASTLIGAADSEQLEDMVEVDVEWKWADRVWIVTASSPIQSAWSMRLDAHRVEIGRQCTDSDHK